MGLVTEGAKRHFHIYDYHDEGSVSYLCTKTLEEEVLLAYAHQTRVKAAGRERSIARRKFEITVKKGSTALITKYFALYTSKHRPPGTVHAQAINTLKPHASFDVFKDYLHFFEKLPNMLLFGKILFVHGGIPRDTLIKERYRDIASLNDPDIRFQMMWRWATKLNFQAGAFVVLFDIGQLEFH